MTLVATATAVTDYLAVGRPQPSASISISGMPFSLGYSYTVWRNANGQRDMVRAARDIPVLGTVGAVADYEVPFGCVVSYQVVVTDAADAIVASVMSNNTQLDITNDVWISDPLAPGLAAKVRLSRESLGLMQYDRDGGALQVVGAALPVAVVGIRHEATAIPIKILTRDRTEAETALAVLRTADPFVMRCPGDYPVPLLMYLTAAQVAADRYVLVSGEWVTRVTLTATMVEPPVATVIVNTRTYATVSSEASTYADLLLRSGYPDYLSLLRGGG